jgi:predicted acyl esterase
MVISGAVTASISFILDQPDADNVLRLCDVYPDGRLMLVLEGHARVAAAPGNYTHTVACTPGNLYTVNLDMGHISLAVNSGHRLSLLLTASNYPKLLVNPNDGSAPVFEHHDPRSVTISISDESSIKVHLQQLYDTMPLSRSQKRRIFCDNK